MLLEYLRSSPRHRITNLLSILHDHVDLIHRMRPDCHIDYINNVIVFQRPQNRYFAQCSDWDAVLPLFC